MQESSKQIKEADSVDQKLSIYESLLNELIDAQQSLKEEYKDDVVSIANTEFDVWFNEATYHDVIFTFINWFMGFFHIRSHNLTLSDVQSYCKRAAKWRPCAKLCVFTHISRIFATGMITFEWSEFLNHMHVSNFGARTVFHFLSFILGEHCWKELANDWVVESQFTWS